MNALVFGLTGENGQKKVAIQRATLDFLVSHLPIIGKAIGEKERVELTKGALIALGNKDFATTKKVFDWTLSHLDAEEYEEELVNRVEKNGGDIAVKTIIQAFVAIF
jgi:hypothetical protein